MATTCTACAAAVPAEARFCPACGVRVVSDAEAACSGCGMPVPADARFCPACGTSAAPTARAPEAERRPVTVLFADAVGSTAFTERAGDEAAYRFVQRCVATMTEAIERHGGTITQFRGDGVMALFGAPVAHEHSAVEAVAAALEIQTALNEAGGECEYRIGMATGPVVVGRVGDDVLLDYTAIGDTANVAARMESAATPGTVLMADTTWRAVRQFVECRPIGDLEVKGKSTPITAHEALRRRPIRTRLEAAVERGLGRFVGRTRELDLLLGHVDALGAGRGHVVELTGEAGIGKSRLLLELRRRLPETTGWHEGHCSASGGDTPYLAIADLLRNAFGVEVNDDQSTIAGRIDSATTSWSRDAAVTVPYLKYLLDIDPGAEIAPDARLRRSGILDALRASVVDAAQRQPRVLVVEDVHWADEATLDALDALADVTEDAPVLLLTTSRPGAAAPFDRRSSRSRVALDGIGAEDATAVAADILEVDDLPDDVALLIASKAEGNPLFVEELTATLMESGLVLRQEGDVHLARPAESIEVPDTLHEVILARIDRLDREARDALQLAAVIGREFTVRLLDRLSGLPAGLDDALGELKAVELIRQKARFPELAYLFKHALTHEVTYSTLLDERRRSLHRLVAQAIEEVYADRLAEHVEDLARHWSEAEEWPRALEYAERAASDAAASFANEPAIRYLEQAIGLAERLADLPRALVLYQRLGDLALGIGELAIGADVFERMADVARRAGDADALSWALAYHGEALAYVHDLERGAASLSAAIAVEDAGAAPRLYAATFLRGAKVIFGFHDDATELEPLLDDGRDDAALDPRVQAVEQSFSLVQRWHGELDTCLRIVETEPSDAIDVLAAQGIYWVRGMAQAEAGRYEAARDTLQQAIARSTQYGETFIRARALNTIGWIHLELGDHAGCASWNGRCLSFLEEVDLPDEEIESNARLNLVDSYLARGHLDLAAAEVERVEAITRGQPIKGTWMLWRFTQRRLLLESALQLARGVGAPDGRIDDAVALATESRSVKYLGKAARLRSRWALAGGDLDAALVEAELALDVATSMGHPPDRWRACALLAEICERRGDADAARDHLVRADGLLADAAASVTDPALVAGVASLRAGLR